MKTIAPFVKIFEKAAYGHSYHQVFEDYLSMCLCAFSPNPKTGLSYYEDEYMEIIKPYKASGTLKYFPELLAEMILYMEEHKDASEGNDLLGEFFQQNISSGRNGQFFTPGHICDFMAKITGVDEEAEPKNVLDPACGSGRMLLFAAKNSKSFHNKFYGVDIDSTCVMMCAINMFLNGLRGEVLCGNALMPDDFRFSYKISFFPLGIFKITEKENSLLRKMNIASFTRKDTPENKPETGQLVLF